MSVYKPARSKNFHFDFQFKGRRYHGSTNCSSRREAEAYERRELESAAGEGCMVLDSEVDRVQEGMMSEQKSVCAGCGSPVPTLPEGHRFYLCENCPDRGHLTTITATDIKRAIANSYRPITSGSSGSRG